jgi:hypothetical protein
MLNPTATLPQTYSYCQKVHKNSHHDHTEQVAADDTAGCYHCKDAGISSQCMLLRKDLRGNRHNNPRSQQTQLREHAYSSLKHR